MYDNESQEMYLETILKIQKRKGSVRSIEIAEEMVSADRAFRAPSEL